MRLTAVIVLLLGFATTSIFAAPDLQDEYLEDISTRDYEDMILEEARDGLDVDFDDIYSRDIEGEEEAFAMAMRDTFDHDDFETRDYLDDLEDLDARFVFDDELESFERDLEDEFEERDLEDEFDLEAREFEEDTVLKSREPWRRYFRIGTVVLPQNWHPWHPHSAHSAENLA